MTESTEQFSDSPVAQRPTLPEGYGLPDTADGLLTWDQVQARLVPALHYWLATVRPDGRPHLIPRWGVWVAGKFFYDGAPTTVHARNLQANPHVSLSLEDGKESVIIEGISEPTRAEPDGLGAELAAAFGKYHDLGYQPGPDSWSGEDGGGLRVITPQRALAWFSFPTDCTRFTWGRRGGFGPG
ncbi:pyridoxamine 5'-phosphate oxidase family protein [Nakamurella lactea]|uniref:pyridoxamine 5'-phosphate oxidase family protein n=1 Tax=Nakamurella lactea TaxID=459515 RepID=UPI000400E5E3|nr:pyridoxamine 5'-phosphate oxidase family protein [Nakamurella lactea]